MQEVLQDFPKPSAVVQQQQQQKTTKNLSISLECVCATKEIYDLLLYMFSWYLA